MSSKKIYYQLDNKELHNAHTIKIFPYKFLQIFNGPKDWDNHELDFFLNPFLSKFDSTCINQGIVNSVLNENYSIIQNKQTRCIHIQITITKFHLNKTFWADKKKGVYRLGKLILLLIKCRRLNLPVSLLSFPSDKYMYQKKY